MTDRELLEQAAKAAAIKIDKSPYGGGGSGNDGFDVMGNAVLDWHNNVRWNPLTDDGDALRLAATLQIQVTPGTFGKQEACAYHPEGACEMREYVHFQQDLAAATRRAIVRAAAEIGRRL